MTRTALLYWASTLLLSFVYLAAAVFYLTNLHLAQDGFPSAIRPISCRS